MRRWARLALCCSINQQGDQCCHSATTGSLNLHFLAVSQEETWEDLASFLFVPHGMTHGIIIAGIVEEDLNFASSCTIVTAALRTNTILILLSHPTPWTAVCWGQLPCHCWGRHCYKQIYNCNYCISHQFQVFFFWLFNLWMNKGVGSKTDADP